GVTCITGSLIINDSAVTDLSQLSQLQMVGGSVVLAQLSLTSLDGLEHLTSAGSLTIFACNSLTNLAPLSNLTHLTADPQTGPNLTIEYNQTLPGCAVWGMQAQTGVTCGGSSFGCTRNYGTGGCGTLPANFQCVPGAQGPGVYDGDAFLNPGAGIS